MLLCSCPDSLHSQAALCCPLTAAQTPAFLCRGDCGTDELQWVWVHMPRPPLAGEPHAEVWSLLRSSFILPGHAACSLP